MLKLRDQAVGGVTLADWLCFSRRSSGLQELRQWVGNAGLLQLVTLFSGTYLKIPSSKELYRMALDFELADAVQRMRFARREGDVDGLIAGEQTLARVSRKLGRNYKWGLRRGKEILRELPKAKAWLQDFQAWRKKFGLEEEGVAVP